MSIIRMKTINAKKEILDAYIKMENVIAADLLLYTILEKKHVKLGVVKDFQRMDVKGANIHLRNKTTYVRYNIVLNTIVKINV